MFLHIGDGFCVAEEELILVLDADTATVPRLTRDFLRKRQDEGLVVDCSGSLPRSLVLCRKQGQDLLYLSRLTAKTIAERADEKRKERL